MSAGPSEIAHPQAGLAAALSRWKPFHALVVGDFMLDRLVYGDAERLSADAPVPVLLVRKEEERPGGAANVCLDLVALGGSVRAFGVVGADANGERLRAALASEGVDASGLAADTERPTTTKESLIGLAQTRHPQKMFRLDRESRRPLSAAMNARIAEAVGAALSRGGVDVVCIEDYDKGVCSEALCREIIDRCRKAGVPVLVDPARTEDYARYAGATAITPNRTEAETASGLPTDAQGDSEVNGRVARALAERHGFDAVVLTLDRHGALLHERSGATHAVPTVARTVYDVTGAGDMFLAGLAAARANGIGWVDAVRFANAAAGLEVEVFGVQPIPFERVHHAILTQCSPGKVRSLEEIVIEVAARRREAARTGTPFRVVFTNGCFDVLHAGHVTLLDRAAEMGDLLIVGINDDASVRGLKGPSRPINPLEDRLRVLSALGSVGAVVAFAGQTPMDLIERIRPDVLVKGGDYTPDRVVGRTFVESYGGRVALVDMVNGRSTTATVARMGRAATGEPG